jgi:hypothetical protein
MRFSGAGRFHELISLRLFRPSPCFVRCIATVRLEVGRLLLPDLIEELCRECAQPVYKSHNANRQILRMLTLIFAVIKHLGGFVVAAKSCDMIAPCGAEYALLPRKIADDQDRRSGRSLKRKVAGDKNQRSRRSRRPKPTKRKIPEWTARRCGRWTHRKVGEE